MILGMSQKPTRAAFFDVDDTLTTSTSMFRFLAFYLATMGRPRREFDERVRELKAMAAVGCAREAINRAYYAHLQGLDAGVVADVARSWFAAELATGGCYHQPVIAALRGHQERGDHVVLVSGSFPAVLDPIAADLGVDDVRCTRPRISDGRYTGDLDGPPMLGAAKADAVHYVTIRAGIDRGACSAYGDHVSDLPMLKAVGTAYVVGGDAGLRSSARTHGWRVLPGAPPAPELPLPRWANGGAAGSVTRSRTSGATRTATRTTPASPTRLSVPKLPEGA
jgi:HAD superfamily hydrolase (TIGR01490 family)